MSIQTRTIEYADGDLTFEAYMAWDASVSGPLPAVMAVHTFAGRTGFEEKRARQLAELGYVGAAIDVYGKGVQGETKEESFALMRPLLDDRELLQRRLRLSLDVVRQQPEVDAARTAAIGFCFGGLCALDLARVGADVLGVVSYHGNMTRPGNTDDNTIKAKVLVLQGWEDSLIPPEHVLGLAQELTDASADWQIHVYGNTMHSFTNPDENSPELGIAYSADADRRSWESTQTFLAELFQ